MVRRGADSTHLLERKNEEKGKGKKQLLPATYQKASSLKRPPTCCRDASGQVKYHKDLALDQARKSARCLLTLLLMIDSIAASLFVLNWKSWQIVRRLQQPPQEGVQDL